MSGSEWVLHFSADVLREGNPHGRYHIVSALAERYRIVWVNPFGFRWPSLRRGGFIQKVVRKLSHLSKGVQSSAEGWVVANPWQVPIFTSHPLQKVNAYVLKRELRQLCRRNNIQRAVLFFSTPRYAAAAHAFPGWPAVFYFSDAYSRHRELSPHESAYMRRQEDELLMRCQRVICCSKPIFRDVLQRAGDKGRVVHFPHQVDYERFEAARERASVPEDLRHLPRPIVGYYGTLTDSNDWATMRYVVKHRPRYSFVFIGKKEISDTGLERFPNVHFLGFRPFDQIPDYGAAFDVAILFWVTREWIQFCSPLKLKEYLALGRPIVSTWIEDVAEEYGDVAALTKTPEQFLRALDQQVTAPERAAIGRGIERVRGDRWRNILPLFEDLF